VCPVRWEVKFDIVFTPISSLTVRVHTLELWTAG
jgi:hypothetical protein